MAIIVAATVGVSTHRRDEYLQAARIAIEPARVQIELDLTPGISLADAIVADIDRDRDGSFSDEEQRTYARTVLSALQLEIDNATISGQLAASGFPEPAAMKRGEGTIRLSLEARLAPLSNGVHHLAFRNRHHPDRSVYLANALVPESADVSVTAQHRDADQTELIIDYVLATTAVHSRLPWLLGSLAAGALLSALLMARSAHHRR